MLADLPPYLPGRPAAAGLAAPYKLSSNENPYPPLPSVLEVVREAALELNRYPDMSGVAVLSALTDHPDVPMSLPGDIWWHVGHVQLYLGTVNGVDLIIEAPETGTNVRIVPEWQTPQARMRPTGGNVS